MPPVANLVAENSPEKYKKFSKILFITSSFLRIKLIKQGSQAQIHSRATFYQK